MTHKEQLQYGKCLMELLKQPLCKPLAMHEQVITLVAATHKKMMHVDPEKVKAYQGEMLEYFETSPSRDWTEIEEKRVLDDELTEKICNVAEEFKDKSRC